LRKTFTDAASQIIANDEQSVILLGDIGVYGFKEILLNYPKRAFNIGILEQSMVSVAAGFSSEGIIPIIHTIAPFMVERALEQIKVDFGYQKLAGNFVSVGSSFDYTKLGCTHHCPGDINILSNIPGINLFIPGHREEFEKQFKTNWKSGDLNYFRLSEHENKEPILLENFEAKKIKSGSKGTVLVVGPMLSEVLSGLAETDIEIHYLNSLSYGKSIKIETNFPEHKVVIIEPYYSGALLLAMEEQFRNQGIQFMQIGIPRKFIEKYGEYPDYLNYLQLDAVAIKKKVEDFINL
jgi:transketolase